MGQKTVQLIIGRILTDEELRARFVAQPDSTLAWLRDKGYDLTDSEMDAIARTDRRLWGAGSKWLDMRLQRCHLTAAGSRVEGGTGHTVRRGKGNKRT
jgi:hypothetical protein